MPRYMLPSFLFLAWVLYEASGGADFAPGSTVERVADTPAARPPSSGSRPEPITVSFAPVATTRLPVSAPPATPEQPDETGPVLLASAALDLSTVEAGLSGLETIQPADPEPVVAPDPEPERDVRRVTGTRVNMRFGPGTNFPVIGKLQMGQQVEVLEDDGNGWVRLRLQQGSQVGWIAASLVSDPGQ